MFAAKIAEERHLMTGYEYNEDFPFVAVNDFGFAVARFAHKQHIKAYLPNCVVVDTTPKPRVPEDARWVTWYEPGNMFPHYARRTLNKAWIHDEGTEFDRLEDLPGVTPDTVFTVLDERKS